MHLLALRACIFATSKRASERTTKLVKMQRSKIDEVAVFTIGLGVIIGVLMGWLFHASTRPINNVIAINVIRSGGVSCSSDYEHFFFFLRWRVCWRLVWRVSCPRIAQQSL